MDGWVLFGLFIIKYAICFCVELKSCKGHMTHSSFSYSSIHSVTFHVIAGGISICYISPPTYSVFIIIFFHFLYTFKAVL